MPNLTYGLKFLSYKLFSKHQKGHGIHSPFVFNLLTTVIEGKSNKEMFLEYEKMQKLLQTNNSLIEILDLGTGGVDKKKYQKKISSIVKHSVTPAKYTLLLTRLIQFSIPNEVFELGTSVGITSLYLSKVTTATIHTIEGSPSLVKIAKRNFNIHKVNNIEIHEGEFVEVLSKILPANQKKIIAFIDGNHSLMGTISAFELFTKNIHPDTMLIFHDIHLNKEMEEAWLQIKNSSKVVVTIDLFFMGIVLFKEGMQKQNYTINF